MWHETDKRAHGALMCEILEDFGYMPDRLEFWNALSIIGGSSF
jgi:hypothetical protein